MADQITLTIDGRSVTAEAGELLIAVAQRAGNYIPRFCCIPAWSRWACAACAWSRSRGRGAGR